jgi:hypothetical protein
VRLCEKYVHYINPLTALFLTFKVHINYSFKYNDTHSIFPHQQLCNITRSSARITKTSHFPVKVTKCPSYTSQPHDQILQIPRRLLSKDALRVSSTNVDTAIAKSEVRVVQLLHEFESFIFRPKQFSDEKPLLCYQFSFVNVIESPSKRIGWRKSRNLAPQISFSFLRTVDICQ